MKILLCNEAFIGDLILSTAVLKPLKKAYPNCQIGFLVGSWGQSVVEDHRLVDFVHVYDQESFNRNRWSKKEKKRREFLTKKKALEGIVKSNYDVAIDLHSYYKENSAHIIFKANIPKRVGYWTCKKPFFYNEIYSHWDCRKYHMLENHKIMMASFGIEDQYLDDFRCCLEYKKKEEFKETLPRKYLLLHPGTGELGREWDLDHWKKLSEYLDTLNVPLVFIGKGSRENDRIFNITKHLRNGLNYCNKFNFKELIHVIQKSTFLIGLESMAGHLAAHLGKPALLIYSGPLPINWRPYHPYCQVVMPDELYLKDPKKLLPKEPISMIKPEAVFDKVKRMLEAHKILKSGTGS